MADRKAAILSGSERRPKPYSVPKIDRPQAGKEIEMRYTKKFAKEILDLWKNETSYFNGSMSEGQFETMLCCHGFSHAEAITITMALILAGAKFAG